MKHHIVLLLIAYMMRTLAACSIWGDHGGDGDYSFPPVSLESGHNTIKLSKVGNYSGDFFDLSSISPPTYDPVSKRIFIPMNDLGRVDVSGYQRSGQAQESLSDPDRAVRRWPEHR